MLDSDAAAARFDRKAQSYSSSRNKSCILNLKIAMTGLSPLVIRLKAFIA